MVGVKTSLAGLGADTGGVNPDLEEAGGQTWATLPPFTNVILVRSCSSCSGGGNDSDKLEVLVSSSGTVGLPGGKRRHGVIFNGGQLVNCKLCFEGEKDSVRLASTDKFSEVDSIN